MIYNAVERETIGLCICLEALNDIVNHSMLMIKDVSDYPGEAEVFFKTSIHRDLFLIRLLDFVKEAGSKQLTGVAGSCLAVLKQACVMPSFNVDLSVVGLRNSIVVLEDWLSEKKEIILWLPSLQIDARINVSRLDYINIAGNHSKHNLSRLTGVSRDVANILVAHGYSVSEEQIPLALDDFREHLAENYFLYYSTWLSELLNNVRWGLQGYLVPMFDLSYRAGAGDVIAYRYEYPAEIVNPIAREWFWRLMNNVRSGPYIKKFLGAHYLKEECSLESD